MFCVFSLSMSCIVLRQALRSTLDWLMLSWIVDNSMRLTLNVLFSFEFVSTYFSLSKSYSKRWNTCLSSSFEFLKLSKLSQSVKNFVSFYDCVSWARVLTIFLSRFDFLLVRRVTLNINESSSSLSFIMFRDDFLRDRENRDSSSWVSIMIRANVKDNWVKFDERNWV